MNPLIALYHPTCPSSLPLLLSLPVTVALSFCVSLFAVILLCVRGDAVDGDAEFELAMTEAIARIAKESYDGNESVRVSAISDTNTVGVNVGDRLSMSIIAPDTLTNYATLLHAAFINQLHKQKQSFLIHHHTPPLSASDSVSSLVLHRVSLYVHQPDEFVTDFILRFQASALPPQLRVDSEDNDDDNTIDDDDVDHFILPNMDGHDDAAFDQLIGDDDDNDGEDNDEDPQTHYWQHPHIHSDHANDGESANQYFTDYIDDPTVDEWKSNGEQPMAYEINENEEPRYHTGTGANIRDSDDIHDSRVNDGNPDHHDVDTEDFAVPPPPRPSNHVVDSMSLDDGDNHINLLLYDGHREDIHFAYFQFMQHLAQQYKSSPTAPPLPLTVLMLYNAWQILHRCEADEETEERIKKLLNLCDMVVVHDEELRGAYQQLCPKVHVIAHGYQVNEDYYECDTDADNDNETVPLTEPFSGHAKPSPASHLLDASVSPSCASTLSTSHSSPPMSPSSLMFSSIPRAPQCSPAASPPLSPRPSSANDCGSDGITIESLSIHSASPTQRAMESLDIHSLIEKKRKQIASLQVQPLSSSRSVNHHHLHQSPTPVPIRSRVVVVGSLPLDEDLDDNYSVSWNDCLQLFRATQSLAAAQSPIQPFLFLLVGFPLPIGGTNDSGNGNDSDSIVTLAASTIEAEYEAQSFTDIDSYKDWLYQHSHCGTKLLTINGMLVNESMWSIHTRLLDVELKLSRSMDDHGCCGRRIDWCLPVYLDASHSLAVQRHGVRGIFIRRVSEDDDSDVSDIDGDTVSDGDRDEKHPGQLFVHDLLCGDEDGDDSFSFTSSHYMTVTSVYQYDRAAVDLLTFVNDASLRLSACQHNQRVQHRWSMERVAKQYLALFQSQYLNGGDGDSHSQFVRDDDDIEL